MSSREEMLAAIVEWRAAPVRGRAEAWWWYLRVAIAKRILGKAWWNAMIAARYDDASAIEKARVDIAGLTRERNAAQRRCGELQRERNAAQRLCGELQRQIDRARRITVLP